MSEYRVGVLWPAVTGDEPMYVNEICSRQVDKVLPDDNALGAARRMSDRNVGALVVVDESDLVLGIITDRDITVRVTARAKEPAAVHVADVMTEKPVTVNEATTARQALHVMRSGGFRRLPVVDRDHKVVGIVTLDDLLELFASLFQDVQGVLKTEGPQVLASQRQ